MQRYDKFSKRCKNVREFIRRGIFADADETVFQNARSTFAAHGYQLPKVIFWNVQSRNLQQPVTWNEQGVALVSGCTPRLFSMVTSGQLSPLQYMLDILGAERYACITA